MPDNEMNVIKFGDIMKRRQNSMAEATLSVQEGNKLVSDLLDTLYGKSAEETKAYALEHNGPPQINIKTIGNHSIPLGDMRYLTKETIDKNNEFFDSLSSSQSEGYTPPAFLNKKKEQ